MTIFRPCIDLHNGIVKQIVGGSYSDQAQTLKTNFESAKESSYYAKMYKKDGLQGGHIIKIGQGNEAAALEALKSYPGGLQIGGGINDENGMAYLEAGASHLILTSWLFPENRMDWDRAKVLANKYGKEKLVFDFSCRKSGQDWFVTKNRWQDLTDEKITAEFLFQASYYCSEFLIHAADVEGKCEGIDEGLVKNLGKWSPIKVTYAGGAQSIEDLEKVAFLSNGSVDLTIGSALDLFGGNKIKYSDCLRFNQAQLS